MTNLLKDLNTEQLRAVCEVNGPLLIVAGAGTGKTTVITRRIGYLIQQGLASAEEILALTFTEKAAGEMEDRTLQLLPIGNYDLWISTFHSFCEKVLKQYGLHIGLPQEFELLTESRQWMLVYKNWDKFELDYFRPLALPNRFIDVLLNHFSKCKDELITPDIYLSYAEKLLKNTGTLELLPDEAKLLDYKKAKEIAGAYRTYQQLLLDNESLDFGDLINYTLDLFIKRPNILKTFSAKFKYILVDEFQDTNFAQYELTRKLAGNPSTANLTVVGDDDQSIYKFRGASVSNILNFKKDFSKTKEITLTKNYRSSQEILDLAYNFIQLNNPNRLEVSLGLSKRLISGKPHEGVIGVIKAHDLHSELGLVIEKILELKSESPETSWNDFAILIRSNSAAEEILPFLEASGVPYTYVANTGLYTKPLISLLISYLKLLDNYHESLSLYQVMSLPIFRIEPSELAKITHQSLKKACSVYEVLRDEGFTQNLTPESVQKISDLLLLLNKHANQASEISSGELFAYVVKDLCIPQLLEEDTLDNAQNRELLDQFYKKIQSYEQSSKERSLKSYLENLKLELRSGNDGEIKFDPNQGPESLKIMTIHASKGLEFENVFLVNMVDQRFPTRHKSSGLELPEDLVKETLPVGDFHLQEERRLFYVAVTRAKTRLFFSLAEDYGGARAKKPSIFLAEAGLVSIQEKVKSFGRAIFSEAGKSKAREIVFKHIPATFSYTDISTFRRCPLEYKFKNYLKLPLPGAAQLSFGITIHRVLQEYLAKYLEDSQAEKIDLFGQLNQARYPEKNFLEELYLKHWIDDWYLNAKQRAEYKQKGVELLEIFYEQSMKDSPQPKYLEKSFKLPIGKFEFVGKIDRADTTEEGLAIIDYKTGKSPKAKNKNDLDQLRVYQWAAQEFLEEPVALLSYWYLDGNQRVSEQLMTGEKLLDFKDMILSEIEKIIETIQYDEFGKLHDQIKEEHFCQFEGFR